MAKISITYILIFYFFGGGGEVALSPKANEWLCPNLHIYVMIYIYIYIYLFDLVIRLVTHWLN